MNAVLWQISVPRQTAAAPHRPSLLLLSVSLECVSDGNMKQRNLLNAFDLGRYICTIRNGTLIPCITEDVG